MNYIPVAEQQGDAIGYWSYSGLFVLYTLYSLPVFLLGGILFSMLADFLIHKIKYNVKVYKYFCAIVLYGAGGVLVNVFFYIVLFDEGAKIESFYILILGVFASLLFLHVRILIKKILNYIIS